MFMRLLHFHTVMFLATLLGLWSFNSVLAAPTKKVPASRAIVSEETVEKPAGSTDIQTAESDVDSVVEVPLDALPETKPNDTEDAEEGATEGGEENADVIRNQMPPPPVMRDFSKLPAPVQRMRELIIEAAKKGEIEALRSLLGIGETATTVSIGGLEGDPIEFLKETSGDPEGVELLAILIEVLEAGYVHLDEGNEDELFIWPYFYAWPLDKLTPPMKVELFRILTAGDLEDSESSGRYIFYRAGIKPDGRWDFFVAGD